MSSLSLSKLDSAALPRLSITNNINKQEEKTASNKSSATSSRPSSIVKGSNLDPIRLKDSELLVKNDLLHPNELNSIDPVNVAGIDNIVTVRRKLTLPDIVRGSQDEIRTDFNTDTKNTQEDLVVGNIQEVSPCLYNLPTFLDILQKKGCSNREYLNSMEKGRKTVLNDSPGPCYGDINYAIGRHVANDYRFSLLKSNKAKQRDLVNENSKKKIQETFGVKDIFTDKKAIRRLQHFSLYF